MSITIISHVIYCILLRYLLQSLNIRSYMEMDRKVFYTTFVKFMAILLSQYHSISNTHTVCSNGENIRNALKAYFEQL